MPKLKASSAKKARYGAYKLENRFTKNKTRKLKRHLKNHPNDNQAEGALTNIPSYQRKSTRSKVPKYHFVTKKTGNGRTYSVKELARPVPHQVAEYKDGIPVISEGGKSAMQLAIENA